MIGIYVKRSFTLKFQIQGLFIVCLFEHLLTDLFFCSIRIWDLLIFVPNLIFLLYLLWGLRKHNERVRQLHNFPILRNFYVFLYLCTTMSILRCFVSVVMKVQTIGGDITDK